jgi:hypothetical protein
VKPDGVGEGRGMVDGGGRGSKVSEDMVVPVAAFRLRVGDRVRTNSRGASTIEENVDIERRRR